MEKNSSIDVIHLTKLLWKHRYIILTVGFISGFLAGLSTFFMDTEYEVNCRIAPSSPNDEISLSSSPSLFAGMSITGQRFNIISEEIISTLKSRSFRLSLFEKYQHDTRLFDDRLIKVDHSDLSQAEKQNKKQELALEFFKEKLIIVDVPNESNIRISIITTNKYFGKNFLNELLIFLKNYINKKNQSILGEDIAFYKSALAKSSNSFVNSEIQGIMNKKIEKQLMLSSNIFSILDEPIVPFKKLSPKRMQIAVLFSLLGLVATALLILFFDRPTDQ